MDDDNKKKVSLNKLQNYFPLNLIWQDQRQYQMNELELSWSAPQKVFIHV